LGGLCFAGPGKIGPDGQAEDGFSDALRRIRKGSANQPNLFRKALIEPESIC
jgi:hypothetical protein